MTFVDAVQVRSAEPLVRPERQSSSRTVAMTRLKLTSSHIGLTNDNRLEGLCNLSHATSIAERGPQTGDVLELISSLLQTRVGKTHARVEAQALLKTFGTAGNLLAASHERLAGCCDSGTADLLRTVYLLMRAVLQEPVEDRLILGDLSALHEYLRFCLAHEKNELVRLLFLNSKNALIKDELHCRGTIDHTPVYPREIVKRAIQLDATALIIVHNHPSGDPSPSEADIAMTKHLQRVLKDIGIALHDHIIVGWGRCESLRLLGHI